MNCGAVKRGGGRGGRVGPVIQYCSFIVGAGLLPNDRVSGVCTASQPSFRLAPLGDCVHIRKGQVSR